MRIGDWSSDVGSSDLLVWKVGLIELAWTAIGLGAVAMLRSVGPAIGAALAFYFVDQILIMWTPSRNVSLSADRKSVVSGKSVSVRVDLGGRRIFTKKMRPHSDYHLCIDCVEKT